MANNYRKMNIMTVSQDSVTTVQSSLLQIIRSRSKIKNIKGFFPLIFDDAIIAIQSQITSFQKNH